MKRILEQNSSSRLRGESVRAQGGFPSEDIVRWMMTHFDPSGEITWLRLKKGIYVKIDINGYVDRVVEDEFEVTVRILKGKLDELVVQGDGEPRKILNGRKTKKNDIFKNNYLDLLSRRFLTYFYRTLEKTACPYVSFSSFTLLAITYYLKSSQIFCHNLMSFWLGRC